MELAASKIPGVVSLAQGIPSFETPLAIREFISERIREGLCDKYSLTNGLQELREEIALALEKDGLRYDPMTEVIVTAGSIEGITASLLALTEPGDEVIIPSPTYTSYVGAINLARCKISFAELDEDNNFDFHVESIRKAITRRTKVILFCSPNNPTGTIFSESKTRELVKLALAHNIKIIVDEVYKDFYYTKDVHFSPALIPEARKSVIRVCSFSKAFAMTGWRVGFVHADFSLTSQILKCHDAMVTCAPVASQYGALAALRFGAQYLDAFREEFRCRRDFTVKMLDSMSHVLDYQMPKASYFAFPRIKDSVPLSRDSHALAYDILSKAKVALVPGSAFGPSGESHLRITFGRAMEDLSVGLERLSAYFSARPNGSIALPRGTQDDLQQKRTRSIFHRLSEITLRLAVKLYMFLNKPKIIAIMGTRGKTIFKRTINELLTLRFKTRPGILSYNTEIGLPLSILNLHVPKTKLQKLFFPFALLARTLAIKSGTQFLVLEFGLRSRQDASKLIGIVKPDWVVITGVGGEDLELPYEAINSAIGSVISEADRDKIFWAKDDPWLQRWQLQERLGFSSAQLNDVLLNTPNYSYALSKELIGESAKLATVSSVMLGEGLGIPKDTIEIFLKRS